MQKAGSAFAKYIKETSIESLEGNIFNMKK